jgi:hypothetical protein
MTLKLSIEREVEPDEVMSLVFGTGALSWEWWHSASARRPVLNEAQTEVIDYTVIAEPLEDIIDEKDRVFIVVDDPDEPEGSGKTIKKNLSLAAIVNAAGRALRGDGAHIDEESSRDMARENLGYADAVAGDAVLQLAVFGEIVYG